MADNIVKTRISLRTDTVENWTANKDVVLLDGEMAVVIDGDSQRLKIGDGQRTFENLPYIADKFVAKDLFARSIAQGYRTSATPTGLAAGAYAEVSGNFGTAHGVQAQVLSGDNYAFVYNGVSLDGLNSRYESHGEGTFSINPVGGMMGFYVGECSLSSILSSYFPYDEISGYYAKSETSSAVEISAALSAEHEYVVRNMTKITMTDWSD